MIEKNYIIGMSDNKISRQYMELTIPEIKRVTLNNEVILWEAVTPETMPSSPLQFDKTVPTIATPIPREMTPTEKAVWYSHYTLWKHIAQKQYNCWVFEHDVNFKKIDILIPPENKHFMTARCVGCMECYFITPRAARLLVHYAETEILRFQVDTFSNYLMVSKKDFRDISYSQNLKISQLEHLGTTIDHPPSSATLPHQE